MPAVATLPDVTATPAPRADAVAGVDAVGVVDDPLELERYTRWVAAADGTRQAESALQLSGLHCAACAGIIEAALRHVDGVIEANVGAAAQRALVRWDPARTRPSALIAAVQRAGYGAVPDAAAPARLARRTEARQALWRLFVAGFCAMQVMMMATPSYVAGPGDLEPGMRQLLNWGGWLLTLPVMLFSATPFFRGAWAGLRARRIGMDVPVALGVLIMFVASTGATFDPAGLLGHEVYFDSLTMFVAFLLGGRWLEMRARHRAAEALEGTLSGLPETAQRLDAEGRSETVSVLRLRPGDRVRVPLGQAFPADGVLLEGRTQADEALLSGESTPVPKGAGAAVVAGSVNVGAPVLMAVQRVGADTRLQAIVAMMRGALSQRPASARLADRWAAPFLITVLVLAAGAAAAWSLIDPSRAVWVAVSVLIVTCPCALSLAAPAVLVASARALAGRGVLLQRLDALETLARVSTVFFDKTGTLTEGRPVLATVVPSSAARAAGLDEAGLRAHVAGLAQWSTHPLSQALQAAAPEDLKTPWTEVQELAGLGLQARDVHGRTWRLGREDWACAAAEPAPAEAASLIVGASPADERDATLRTVWLGRDGHEMARFTLDEAVRPDAAAAVAALRADGLHLTLLSGDSAARVQPLARQLGLDAAIAAASPEDKCAAVAAAQARGAVVAMVGDGINDAPVLARADVALAMGQGALIARGQADAVIVSNRLSDLVAARHHARRALSIARQNIAWAASYNAVCIPLALAGWLPPWAAGLGMALSSLLVVLNALRAAR